MADQNGITWTKIQANDVTYHEYGAGQRPDFMSLFTDKDWDFLCNARRTFIAGDLDVCVQAIEHDKFFGESGTGLIVTLRLPSHGVTVSYGRQTRNAGESAELAHDIATAHKTENIEITELMMGIGTAAGKNEASYHINELSFILGNPPLVEEKILKAPSAENNAVREPISIRNAARGAALAEWWENPGARIKTQVLATSKALKALGEKTPTPRVWAA